MHLRKRKFVWEKRVVFTVRKFVWEMRAFFICNFWDIKREKSVGY
jgi:hypothetical protein